MQNIEKEKFINVLSRYTAEMSAEYLYVINKFEGVPHIDQQLRLHKKLKENIEALDSGSSTYEALIDEIIDGYIEICAHMIAMSFKVDQLSGAIIPIGLEKKANKLFDYCKLIVMDDVVEFTSNNVDE